MSEPSLTRTAARRPLPPLAGLETSRSLQAEPPAGLAPESGPVGVEDHDHRASTPVAGRTTTRVVAGLVMGLVLIVAGSMFMPSGTHAEDPRSGQAHGAGEHGPAEAGRRPALDHGHDVEAADPWPALPPQLIPPADAIGDIAGAGLRRSVLLADGIAVDGRTLLGQFENDCHIVLVWLDPRGPRYSVERADTHEILVDFVDRAELLATLPDLVVPTVAEGGMSRLMLADPDYWGIDRR